MKLLTPSHSTKKAKLSNPCTIYLVRHGETDWNKARKLQGWKDIPLNRIGKEQALKLSDELKDIKFDAIFSSDLLRAKETAEIIAKRRKLIVKTSELLRERRLGKLEGSKFEKFRDEFFSAYKSNSPKEILNFEEKYDLEKLPEFMQKVIVFIKEVALAYRNKKVLMVTHGGTMRMILVKVGIVTLPNHTRIKIDNTAYIKILTDGDDIYLDELKGISLI